MKSPPVAPTAVSQASETGLTLSGPWTARGIGAGSAQLEAAQPRSSPPWVLDAAGIDALDTAGAWILQGIVVRLSKDRVAVKLQGLRPEFGKLLDVVTGQMSAQAKTPAAPDTPTGILDATGRWAMNGWQQAFAMLSFVGENLIALAGSIKHPARLRWRPVLFNIRTAGFDALPIVGLLSFLLGVVVAYQGAAQLRQYGANIFVADLVGLSMLREFAPLMTAIIIAGRSGSAYAAQIGTMSVTEEIDAMRTIGIAPLELLVLPKLLALVIVMPLLTVFADVTGMLGGMLMAQVQLGVLPGEFTDRLVKAVSVSSYLVGISKAPVFATIIVIVGCFQGFRTEGGADSVGRQTTRSVVQSIFLVIVADALFSVAFSVLDL
jgi:phospholipid/cholesterol/gamma-HCH transport system permease protein